MDSVTQESARAPSFTQSDAQKFVEYLIEQFTVEQLYSPQSVMNAAQARHSIDLCLLKEFVEAS